jgi:hypothetical protein
MRSDDRSKVSLDEEFARANLLMLPVVALYIQHLVEQLQPGLSDFGLVGS